MKNEILNSQFEQQMLELIQKGHLNLLSETEQKLKESEATMELMRKAEMDAAYKMTNYVIDRYCQITASYQPIYEKEEVKKVARNKKMRLVKDIENNVFSVIFHILNNGNWVLNFKKDDIIIDVIKELKYLYALSVKYRFPEGTGKVMFWDEIITGDPRQLFVELETIKH